MMDVSERIKMLAEYVEIAPTKVAKEWRGLIFSNIVKYIKESNGDNNKFKDLLFQDYLAWAAWYFDGEKYPLFLTKKQYQMYQKFRKFDTNTWFYQRRAGKSMGTAVLVIYYAMTNVNKKVLIFAPTEDQLVLMQSIRSLLGQECATELYNQFIGENVIKSKSGGEDDSLNKLGAVFNQKFIRLLNGSDITAVTLNVLKGGSSRRGFSANLIVADEFQDIPPEIRAEIIEPIIMDSFSEDKRLIYIGTPHLKVDRKLDLFWLEAKNNPNEGTLHSHCWEAVSEGIRTPKKMMSRFRKLQIPCRWVLQTGICPVYLPKMYEEKTGQAVPVDERGFGKVPCGKICMDNPIFVQEDMAMFSKDVGLAIPAEWIRISGKPYEFTPIEKASEWQEKELEMSVDYGDIHADTQVCIWNKIYYMVEGIRMSKIRLIYQEIINDAHVVGTRNPSNARLKELFHIWNPKRIWIDTTGKREQVTELMIMQEDKTEPIPRNVFVVNETAKAVAAVGLWWTGPSKAEMFSNMREAFRQGKIEVPNNDIVFWDKYFNELVALAPSEATQTRPYANWGVTMHLTDAIAMGCLTLKEIKAAASMDFAFFGQGTSTDDDD